jgi:hypothetical protein
MAVYGLTDDAHAFSGFHGNDCSYCDVLGSDTIQPCRLTPTFRSNMLPPSSESTLQMGCTLYHCGGKADTLDSRPRSPGDLFSFVPAVTVVK